MATNIDQALMPFDPMLLTDEPAIEIEIEDPEGVKIGIDGVEIDFQTISRWAEKTPLAYQQTIHQDREECKQILWVLVECSFTIIGVAAILIISCLVFGFSQKAVLAAGLYWITSALLCLALRLATKDV